MTHNPEQTVSISTALVDLAKANKLTHLYDAQYEQKVKDENGVVCTKRLTMTELGFVSTEAFNLYIDHKELQDKYKDLKSQLEIVKGEKITLIKQNKEITEKTHLKLGKILRGSSSDKEKVLELIKYLNV